METENRAEELRTENDYLRRKVETYRRAAASDLNGNEVPIVTSPVEGLLSPQKAGKKFSDLASAAAPLLSLLQCRSLDDLFETTKLVVQ